MGDNAHPVHAQQRRAAVSFGVHLLLHAAQRTFQQQRAHHPDRILAKLTFQQMPDSLCHTLTGLEDDVANKTVAHNNICPAFKQVPALDIALEVKLRLAQQSKGFLGNFVALRSFTANAHQPDNRPLTLEHLPAIDCAHRGKLCKQRSTAVYVRACIDQHKGFAARWHDRRDRGSFYRPKCPQFQGSSNHRSARVARRYNSICLALLHEINGTAYRGVLLLPHSKRGCLTHADNFRRMVYDHVFWDRR